jgi:hypothetical protein
MGTAIVQSGDYKLQMATGNQTNEFILGESILGGSNVLGGETEFADITGDLQTITISRGRRKPVDQFQTGNMSFTAQDNNDIMYQLNPLNTSSVYFDSATNAPGLAPMRQVQLSREGTFLFKGRVISFDYGYQLGELDQVSASCADDMLLLAQAVLPETIQLEALSGARLSGVLNDPAVAYPSTRNISAGTVTLGAYGIPANTSVQAYVQRINDAEQGRIFVSRDGNLTFQDRIGASLTPATATFNDTGTGIPYNGITIEFDQQAVVNRASVTTEFGTPQVASNATSQDAYFIQAKDIAESLLSTDAQAATLADYLLNPNPTPRFTSISLNYSMLTDAQRATITALDIGSVISVTRQIAEGDSITQILAVEGIDATITVAGGHSVTLYISSQTVLTELILGDLVYGTLGTTNVLG